ESKTQSSFDESIVFSNYTLAEQNVFGIYTTFGQTNAHRARYSVWYGINSDIEFYHSSGDPNAGVVPTANQQMACYVGSVTNTSMNTSNGAYAMIYNGIEQANVVIKGLRNYGNVESDPQMAYLLGEALTMRAVLYYDLLRAWSDVPARFEPVTSETIYLPKSNRDVIYKQLIADLQEAAPMVPWPNETAQTSTVERVNKAYVKGLLARLCLVASGYAQRPDVLNSGSGASSIRLSDDPELSKAVLYPIALNACQDVIESGTCALKPHFIDVWKANMADVVSAGSESLFEIPYSNTRGRWMYTWAVRHVTADKYIAASGYGGQGGPVANLFYDYDVKDERRDVTCVPFRWNNGVQELNGLSTWYFGKYRFEWMTRFAENTTDHGINPIYMRYSDVLLMAAECANELNDLPKAKTYFKQVRERAFPNNPEKVTEFMSSLGDKTAMFNAIVDERAFEFCGEFVRKADLIRWNLLGSKMQEAKQKMTDLSNQAGKYSDLQTNIYYKLNADGETLSFYGLNHGELDNPGADWTGTTFIGPTKLTQEKINGLYWQDPDKQQFWPIYQVYIDASAGALVNDYTY
ncbi:MAG: RagB/SusD family nutrient uptake outer membrane protein, partial [Prolixibacteraceae bacterium]